MTIRQIVEESANEFGVSVEAIYSPSRMKEVSNARHVAMWLVRRKLGYGYARTGRAFRRDHTSVMSACAKVESCARSEIEFSHKLRNLQQKLGVRPTNTKVHIVLGSINREPKVYLDEATAFAERKKGEVVWSVNALA